MVRRLIAIFLSLTMIGTIDHPYGGDLACAQPASLAGGDFMVSQLPVPGTMVNLSAGYEPVLIRGLAVHPENPLLFDFIIDTGRTKLQANDPQLAQESQRLIKYFLATVTIPENELWVNLSPYEKNRIIPGELGQTGLGVDMLAQDYILKQLTASLIYPEKNLGKDFWDSVYTKSQQMYGTTQVPVDAFNKVWILADKAKVYVHGNTAFIVGAHLKVMLEEDYLALSKHQSQEKHPNALASQIIRRIILPEIEKEVNGGRNFARLRQIFYSMILATWYKKNLKEALLNQAYAGKGKTSGVDVTDKTLKDKIYRQYLQAYKKGVFNYIKEEVDAAGVVWPRKYFSGGLVGLDRAQVVGLQDPDAVMFSRKAPNPLFMIKARMEKIDSAMKSDIDLDINKPVLPQIERIPSALDPRTVFLYAQEFINRLSQQPDYKDSAIKRAIEKFGKRELVIVIGQYFIKQRAKQGTRDTSRLSNEDIVKEATDWMQDPDTGADPVYPHLHFLNDARVLVTGAAGTLGKPTVITSLGYVDKVFPFQKGLDEKHSLRFTNVPDTKGERVPIYGNLKNPEDLIEAMGVVSKGKVSEDTEKEIVIHMGGLSLASIDAPATMFANIINIVNVLMSMRKKGIKNLVFVSTRMVHDIGQSPYAMSEYIIEKIIRKFCPANGIQFRIIRSPNVAGNFEQSPGEFIGDNHLRLIPTLIDKIRKGEPFKMPAEAGRINISIIDYTDFVEAMIRTLATFFGGHVAESLTVDLVPPKSYTLKEIVEYAQRFSESEFVKKGGGKPLRVEVRDENPDFQEDLTPPLSPLLATHELGWQARNKSEDLEDIFKQVWDQTELPRPKEPPLHPDDEVKYMQEMPAIMLDSHLLLDTEDHLECFLGLLAFSAKGDILKQLRGDLKGFDPDLQLNFIKQVRQKDMLKKLEKYKEEIKGEKGDLYAAQRMYISLIIKKFWPSLKSDPAMRSVPGGIDLNAQNLQMEISQQDKAMVKFDPALIEEFKKGDFSGLLPVIVQIKALPRNYFTKYSVP